MTEVWCPARVLILYTCAVQGDKRALLMPPMHVYPDLNPLLLCRARPGWSCAWHRSAMILHHYAWSGSPCAVHGCAGAHVHAEAARLAAPLHSDECLCSVTAVQGQSWVRMCVVGQSFMLHQIRKMVGLAVAVFRGAAPGDAISMALQADRWALSLVCEPCGRSWGCDAGGS